MKWWNRHLKLELAALGLFVAVCYTFERLEHTRCLRIARHIDGVSILLTISLALGIAGVFLPLRSGESKFAAIILFVFLVLAMLFVPGSFPPVN